MDHMKYNCYNAGRLGEEFRRVGFFCLQTEGGKEHGITVTGNTA